MKRSKAVLWVIVMTVIAIALFWNVAYYLENKGAYKMKCDFPEVAEECDVLFLGTSHMLTEVYPLELWHDYGITSYNMAGYAQTMPVTYWTFLYALEHANPKVVVVDCYMIESDEVAIEDGFMHLTMDSIPFSKTKVQAVCDLYDDLDSRIEYLWDFSLYHDRWDELTWKDFDTGNENARGALFQIGVSDPDPFVWKELEAEPIDSVGVDYLRKIMEECRKRDIKVILTYLPFPANESKQRAAAYAAQFAGEYGVDYINFLQMDLVDYRIDCLDADSHLNAAGGHKVTSYIGQYLSENCGLADRRQDGLQNWDQDYEDYQRYKIERLRGQESLQNYLVMMADRSFSLCLFVDGESKIWEYEKYADQVKNLVPEYSFSALDRAVEQGEDYLLLLDHKNGVFVDFYGDEGGEAKTSFGKVVYTQTDTGEKALYLGESDENLLRDRDEEGRKLTVQTVVIDHENGEIVDMQKFRESLLTNK